MKSEATFGRIDKDFMIKNVGFFLDLIKEWEYGDWKESNFLFDLPNKWDYSRAIYIKNELIGFCMASGKIQGHYYIHLLFIKKEYRSKGIAAELFKVIKNYCKNNSLKGIILRCPRNNSKAIDFYQKMLFKVNLKTSDVNDLQMDLIFT